LIQEIIILNDKGIPIFCHDFSGSSNEDNKYQLIGSYFDQLCRFAKYGFKESLTTIKMNKSVFYFKTHPNTNFHLIIKCDSKIDSKKLKKKSIDNIAIKIFDNFFVKFKSELMDFNGNITPFKRFSKDIDEMIKPKGLLRSFVISPGVF
jgi:hypothetical protein